ncbi:hypothetical protein K501DRAFT_283321 [Backusella circina FSU 941]|nr:hypothetical protein K501DRAFT_283321 [Backusella circina FSU 941]
MENVSKVTLADPSSMPLARFCKEMESSTHLASTTSLPRLTDSVMESPRLLPFPYHNDAYFLPTAEHDYPGYSTDTSSMSSSRQYMSSLASVNRGNFSRLQTPAGRVSPMRQETFEDWKNEYVKDQKHFISRIKNRILRASCSNSNSAWYKKLWDRLSTTKPQIKKKTSMVTLKPSQFDTGMRNSTSCTPVWYSQFRCNPTPPPTHSVFLS